MAFDPMGAGTWQTLARWDRQLLVRMRTHHHTDANVERAVALFSRSGEHAAAWFVLGAVGLAFSAPDDQRRLAWQRGLLATAAAYALNTAIKYRVRRPRPQLEGLPALTPVVSALSFPSAHATTSFAAATAYSRSAPGASAALYMLAGAYAVSRPYLGVHYPSDVAVGAALGTVTGLALRGR
ncbi:MAG: phosphatase PAP2 family protein [Solirubrobacteraceae bacterium]